MLIVLVEVNQFFCVQLLFLSQLNSPYKPPVKQLMMQLMMQLEMGQFVSFRRSHVIMRKTKPKKLPVVFQ